MGRGMLGPPGMTREEGWGKLGDGFNSGLLHIQTHFVLGCILARSETE
jgi:hypothetical protein